MEKCTFILILALISIFTFLTYAQETLAPFTRLESLKVNTPSSTTVDSGHSPAKEISQTNPQAFVYQMNHILCLRGQTAHCGIHLHYRTHKNYFSI